MTIHCIICASKNFEGVVLNDLHLLRCRYCGLIRRETFDVPLSHYEEIDPADTAQKREARLRNSLDRINTLSRFVPLSKWCDVGTGDGIFLEALAKISGQGVGIEPGELGSEKAREHGVRIVGKSIEDITEIVAHEDIQVISLFHVIEHLERPGIEIKRIYDDLPVDGFLVLETPNIDSSVFKLRAYKDPLIYSEHLWYFSKKTLRVLLEQTGFHIVATGGRDFDQNNLPIRESLFRLGLSKKNTLHRIVNKDLHVESAYTPSQKEENHNNFLRTLLRHTLSRFVVATGRLQYVWIVAQKTQTQDSYENRR